MLWKHKFSKLNILIKGNKETYYYSKNKYWSLVKYVC